MPGLNPAQKEAAQTLRGPLLVLAGAGTGKTRVVTHRIARLIGRGTPAERILAVTFTNKAAAEMRSRALQLLGGGRRRGVSVPEVSTFHSLCVRILRRRIERLGYPKNFAIYDRSDQEGVARDTLREIRAPQDSLKPGDLLNWIGGWKSSGLSPTKAAGLADSDRAHLAAIGYRRYQRLLKSRGAVDFDDLLLLVDRLFRNDAEARRAEAGRFDHVLIDEYQDTNATQYHIVRHLALGHRNLCVVGDDDQSIYGWRGAEVTHILRFKRDWPDAKVVRLEMNYRSNESILCYANTLIAHNKDRHDKVLKASREGGPRPRVMQLQSEEHEAQFVVGDIAAQINDGCQPRDMAILCRTNEQPRSLETELRQARIPYVLVGGMSFFDRREVRDILSYLKIIIDPKDEPSLLRILNNPPRGIGKKAQEKLLEAAVASGQPLWEILTASQQVERLAPSAAGAVAHFVSMMARFQSSPHRDKPARLIPQIIDTTGYREQISRLYREPLDQSTREAALEEVVRAAASYEQRCERPKLGEFLQHLALTERDEQDTEDRLQRNAVALMTLHSAKGLEFPHVYLVGMEEGILPHEKAVVEDGPAIDEERRLCYVGITRAQERLTLSLALTRRKWGKPRDRQPSRFLYEMTGQAEKWQPTPRKGQGPHQRAPTRRGAADKKQQS